MAGMWIPVIALVAFLLPVQPQPPEYARLFEQGVTYDAFLSSVDARAADWQRNSAAAQVADEAVAAVRAMPRPRKLLVVAAASCSDSVSTLPYLAKLAALSEGKLALRVVDPTAGRPVMEAHRAPDGRAATPTLAILEDDGTFVAAWVERPGTLQRWYDESRKTQSVGALQPQKMEWYAEDAGRTTISDVVALLVK